MTYIKPEARIAIAEGRKPQSCGELNYVITRECIEYMKENPWTTYGTLNNVLGVLEAVKLELYRRMVVPQQEEKRHEYGEVYP